MCNVVCAAHLDILRVHFLCRHQLTHAWLCVLLCPVVCVCMGLCHHSTALCCSDEWALSGPWVGPQKASIRVGWGLPVVRRWAVLGLLRVAFSTCLQLWLGGGGGTGG